jgi:cell division protein ZapE
VEDNEPLARYRALLASGELTPDPAQELAMEKLQLLHHRLARYQPDQGRGWTQRLFGRGQTDPAPEGVYIHGDVGRGKSMLMDLFYAGAPIEKKGRVHFHEFMGEVHARIEKFRKTPAKERAKRGWGDDPLPPIAGDIAAATHLLCFDEFEVSDIADAMILGRLFGRLFELGVVMVSTSNRAPDDLYKGGLNRQLFLPFIKDLKARQDVLCLEGLKDYRQARMHGVPVYHTPLGAGAQVELDSAFANLTDQPLGEGAEIKVKGRTLKIPQQAKGVARFHFADLCEKPLGTHDYLALTKHFHTMILAGIPQLGPDQRNEARRFVLLIDILYDNAIKLIASAATDVDGIYPAGDGCFEFQRTASRLMEMQSAEYFDAPHRAVADI